MGGLESLRAEAFSISLSTPRPLYVLGRTGAGKTTLIANIIHQITTNTKLAAGYSIILVDPHGDLAFDLLRVLPDLDQVSFFDPWLSPFSQNALKLPTSSSSPWPRERLIEWFADTNTQAFSQQLGLSATRAPRATAIYRRLLQALYLTRNDPTLLDLYRLNQSIFAGATHNQIGSKFNLANEALETLLPIIENSLRLSDSLLAIDYRLHSLVASPTLRRTFCTRESTIDFRNILEPGQITCFRLASTDLPAYVQVVAIASIILNVWFTTLSRASLPPDRRTPVLLFLDEFPIFAGLDVFETILVQGRKSGLFPVICHQNLAQLSDRQLQSILANISVRVAFACSADDARRLAYNMHPHNSDVLACEIANLGRFEAIVDVRWSSEEFTPVRIRCLSPPHELRTSEEVMKYLSRLKDEHIRALAAMEIGERPRWVARYYPPQQPPPPSIWPLIVAFMQFDRDRRPITLTALSTSGFAYIPHNKPRLAKLLDEATARGYVQPIRVADRVLFTLSEPMKHTLFPYFSATATAKAGLEEHRTIRLQVLWKYAKLGYYPITVDEAQPSEDPDAILIPPADDHDEWDLPRARALEVEIWPEKHPDRVRWHLTNDQDNHQLYRVLFATTTEQKRQAILNAIESSDKSHLERVDIEVTPLQMT